MNANTKVKDRDIKHNPMGLDGFEFVEFAAPERGILEPVFTTMGFVHIANHRSKDVVLFRQGDINFIINYEPSSYAYYFAKEHGLEYFIGSETDVLDRFYQCAKEFSINDIVRMTPDCPFIDPIVIDKILNAYMENSFDFVSNTLERTFPFGNDVEVFSFSSLEKSWKEAKKSSEREHVTPFIYNNPNLFSILQVKNPDNLTNFHWTLDRDEDLLFMKSVFQKIQKKPIHIDDILKILKEEPELGLL